MSPFLAQISLKKSLVINKSGVHCLPPAIRFFKIFEEEHAIGEGSRQSQS